MLKTCKITVLKTLLMDNLVQEHTCKEFTKCPQHKETIYQKLIKADGIVFISAVYWHDLTKCMKALIDPP